MGEAAVGFSKVIERSLTRMRPRIATDDALLDIARDCFLSHGPSVSTTYIAQKAGVSQATLFKRFGKKHDLITRALGLEDVRPWLPRLEAGPDARTIEAQLTELAEVMVRFFDRTLPAMMALHAAGPDFCLWDTAADGEPPPPIRARHALARWFTLGQAQGRLGDFEVDATAVAFIGALQAPALRRHMLGDTVDLGAYVANFISTFWRGIAP